MKLATLEKIVDIQPIEQADQIELAQVLGWNVVVKKNQFVPGDWCVYIPIDTIIDRTIKGFESYNSSRIKTKYIRGVWSQGLVINILELDQTIQDQINSNLVEGEDIAKLINVTKYEKIDEIANFIKSSKTPSNLLQFPTHILSKTDEDNLRTKNKCLGELDSLEIYISKKMDGSSMTLIYGLEPNNITICSKNLVINSDNSNPMCQYVINNGLDKLNLKSIAIQGEFCGPKINSNKLGLKTYEFYVFNIKDLETDKYYGLEQIIEFVKANGLQMVPILDKFVHNQSIHTIQWFQEFANKVTYGINPGEGIVIRPVESIYSRTLHKNLSCKVINQLYKD